MSKTSDNSNKYLFNLSNNNNLFELESDIAPPNAEDGSLDQPNTFLLVCFNVNNILALRRALHTTPIKHNSIIALFLSLSVEKKNLNSLTTENTNKLEEIYNITAQAQLHAKNFPQAFEALNTAASILRASPIPNGPEIHKHHIVSIINKLLHASYYTERNLISAALPFILKP